MSRNKQPHNAQAEEKEGESTQAPAEKQSDKAPVYVIAEGISRTSDVGVLNAGDTVKPEYFKGGQEVFDRLLESKVIVRKP